MKKIEENEIVKRRIELLKKYYPIDEENKIVTIKLYYEHASELLDYTVGEESCEMFDNSFLEKLNSVFEKIPVNYKADVILEIKDYDGYSPEDIMEKFNDLIELNSYNVVRTSKKNKLVSALLILIGVLILVFNQIFFEYEIYGIKGELESLILQEFFDIVSWVFIWQAVTVLFLSPTDVGIQIFSISKKLNKFCVAKDNDIIIEEKRDSILNRCKIDTSFSKVKKNILLVTSTTLIFFGLIYLIDPLKPSSWAYNESYAGTIIGNIIAILIGVTVILAGINGLSRFSNKKLKLGFSYPLVFIVFIFLLLFWILFIISASKSDINDVITLTVIVLVYLGYLISSKNKKKN